MVPLSLMTPDMNLADLKAPAGTVDHVDMMYNAGHPGVAEPHVHIVLWNIPDGQLPPAALKALPDVAQILKAGSLP